MLDIVAGKNRDGTFGRKRPLEQSLRDIAGRCARLRVGRGAPCAIGVALSKEDPIGSRCRPVIQRVGQPIGISSERINGRLPARRRALQFLRPTAESPPGDRRRKISL